jgi:hypothetical protein
VGNFIFFGKRTFGWLGVGLFILSWQACSSNDPPPEAESGANTGVFKNSGLDPDTNPTPVYDVYPTPTPEISPTPSPNPTSTVPVLTAPKSFDLSAHGYRTALGSSLSSLKFIEVTVTAKSKLKIKIKPKAFQEMYLGAPRNMYSKISVYIYLNGQKSDCTPDAQGNIPATCYKTGPLNIGQSYTIDLSSRLSAICPSANTYCQVKIGFIKPNYSYYCDHLITFGDGTEACSKNSGMYNLYSCVETLITPKPAFCASTANPKLDGHQWGFEIKAETDFTTAL